jgi:glycerol-3-phosphate dehydrogenase
MAKALVDKVSRKLASEYATPAQHACETDQLALDYDENELEEATNNMIENQAFDAETVRHLVEAYGPGTAKVLEITGEKPPLSSKITGEAPYLLAEVAYAARYEMALRLIDFMLRRTQLAYRLRDHGRSIIQNVASIMANELGWSAETLAQELIEFENECELIDPR